MEELSSFPLTRAQKADYFHVHNRNFFQIQDDAGTAAAHLVCNLAQMLRPHPPNQADSGSFSIKMSFEL
jgi:hypothetical protein